MFWKRHDLCMKDGELFCRATRQGTYHPVRPKSIVLVKHIPGPFLVFAPSLVIETVDCRYRIAVTRKDYEQIIAWISHNTRFRPDRTVEHRLSSVLYRRSVASLVLSALRRLWHR